MSQSRRLLGNTAILSGAELLAQLANLALVVVVARRLGVARFGLYSLVMTFSLFARTVSLLGLPQVVIRDVAQNRGLAGTYLASALSLTVPAALGAWALVPLVAWALGYGHEVTSLLLLAGGILMGATVAGLGEAIARSFERMALVGAIRIGVSFLTAGVSVALALRGAGVRTLVAVQVGAAWVEALVMVCVVHLAVTPLTGRPVRSCVRALIRDGLLLLALSLIDVALRRVDVLILGRLSGTQAVGWYMPGVRLMEYVNILRMGALGALFPHLSARWAHAKEDVAGGYNQALRAFAAGGFGIATILSFGADDLVRLVVGESYLPGAPVVRILAWSMLATVLSGPVLLVIIVSRTRLAAFVPVAAGEVVMKAALCIILVPRSSHVGAAAAAFLTALASLAVRTWWIRGLVGSAKASLVSVAWQPAVAAAIAAVVFALFPGGFWGALLPATAAYAGILWALARVAPAPREGAARP